jgi:hypothetical protein
MNAGTVLHPSSIDQKRGPSYTNPRRTPDIVYGISDDSGQYHFQIIHENANTLMASIIGQLEAAL